MEVEIAERRQRERDGPNYQILHSNVREIERIERKFRYADSAMLELVVDTGRLLSPEFQLSPAKNIEAETKFRKEVYAELVAKPTVVVYSSDQRARGFHLWWGRDVNLPSHGGLVTFGDLLEVRGFGDRYERDVRNSPAVKAVRDWYAELKSGIESVMDDHRNRVELNEEHPVVRRIAEFFGGPSPFELMTLQLKLRQNPNDVEAKAKLHHLLGVSDASAPSFSDWDPILSLLELAAQGIRDAHPEGTALALASAQDLAVPLAERVAEYEEKVLGGAGAAVGILEKLKVAGEVAATFVGGGVASRLGYGLVGVAVGSGVGAGVNTSAQGVAEGWGLGYGEGVDLSAIAKRSAVDAVLTSFTTLIGGKFASAIEGKLLSRGFSPRAASVLANSLGAGGSATLTAPANAVVRHLALSGQMPQSVDELVELIAEEAVKQAIGGAAFGAIAPVSASGVEPSGGGVSRPVRDAVSPTADTVRLPEVVSPTADTVRLPEVVSPTADTVRLPEVVSPTADTVRLPEVVSPTADTVRLPEVVSPTADTVRLPEVVSPTADTVRLPEVVSPTADTIPGSDTVGSGRPKGSGAGPPGGGGRPPPAATGPGAPAVNLRNVVPPEPARWWTDGSRVYEKVGGEWVYRGRPKINPDDTIRGEVRVNHDTGYWEIDVEGTWYNLARLPELPEWARTKK